ncbi:resolvase [Xanthomonas axonopodis Xac29-1]|nr:resolvase [Xanthomonas axonopodis Xac29-1]
MHNRVADSIGARQHFIIPEAQQLEAFSVQEGLAHGIGGRLQMLAAVKFYDERTFQAGEIGDIRADRTLPAELESQQTPITQAVPKQTLGSGLIRPGFPSIELAKARDKYRGRPADQAIHARIVALRGRGETIANTARLAGTSVTTVKRVWAAHQAQQES